MQRIEDFGAVGDGKTECTEAIQRAIDLCESEGGGTVVLEAGTYVSATVQIKSNVELRIAAGATLMALDDEESYPEIPNIFIDGTSNTLSPERKGFAFVYAYEAQNISITGGGTIDVGGQRFQGRTRRPFLLRIIQCRNVLLEDVTLTNSAAWTCHLQKSDQIVLKNLTVRASGVRNGDGIDIDSSTNVTITGCDVRTGDDAVCCKTTFADPCENIEVTDCTLESHCSGFKIGTESVGDFRNIRVADCTIQNCGVVAVKVTAVDGGSVANVRFSNLNIVESTGPIFVSNGDRKRRYMDDADPDRESVIQNLRFDDLRITTRRYKRTTRGRDVTDYGQGIVLSGNPDNPLRDIQFHNVHTAFWGGVQEYDRTPEDVPTIRDEYPECHQLGILPAYGYFVQYARDVVFEGCTESVINADSRPLRWERSAG